MTFAISIFNVSGCLFARWLSKNDSPKAIVINWIQPRNDCIVPFQILTGCDHLTTILRLQRQSHLMHAGRKDHSIFSGIVRAVVLQHQLTDKRCAARTKLRIKFVPPSVAVEHEHIVGFLSFTPIQVLRKVFP